MKKALLTLAACGLVLGGSPLTAAPRVQNPDGTTTEVRYISNAGIRKGNPLAKLIITRDASGKVISVKRR